MKIIKLLLATAVGGLLALNAGAQSWLNNGLIAYYPFNGNANDASGNMNNPTLVKAALSTDRFGNSVSAMSFDGLNSYILTSDAFPIIGNSPRTISFWFKFPILRYGQIIYWGNFSASGKSSGISLGLPGQLVLHGNYSDAVFVPAPLAANVWHHVCMTYNGNIKTAFCLIDGVAVPINSVITTGGTAWDTAANTPLCIGRNYNHAVNINDGWTTPFMGQIDDVRIYNRALSASEVAQLYAYELRPPASIARTDVVEAQPPAKSNTDSTAPDNPLPSMANASALETTEVTIPASVLTAAGKLLPPTNKVAEISNITAEVCGLSSKGLLMQTNFVYLPRIPIEDLSQDELSELLEIKAAYSDLTAFGNYRSRTEQSEIFERQMQQLWLHGKNLQDKIQTRLAVLDEMRSYNGAISTFASGVRLQSQSQATAANINQGMDANLSVADQAASRAAKAEEYRALGISEASSAARSARRVYNTAQNNMAILQNNAAVVENQNNAASQQMANGLSSVSLKAAKLAGYGIIVPSAPPFFQIPPLAMRLEVDVERIQDGAKVKKRPDRDGEYFQKLAEVAEREAGRIQEENKRKVQAARLKKFYWNLEQAEKGSTSALIYIGKCYRSGDCVEKDLKTAKDYFRKASDLGSIEAAQLISTCE